MMISLRYGVSHGDTTSLIFPNVDLSMDTLIDGSITSEIEPPFAIMKKEEKGASSCSVFRCHCVSSCTDVHSFPFLICYISTYKVIYKYAYMTMYKTLRRSEDEDLRHYMRCTYVLSRLLCPCVSVSQT